MSNESPMMVQLLDRLIQWEALRDLGHSVSIDELCIDSPELGRCLGQLREAFQSGAGGSMPGLPSATAAENKELLPTNNIHSPAPCRETPHDPFATLPATPREGAPLAGMPPRSPAPDPLKIVADDETVVPGYEILEELGRGGMGRVLRGRDPKLGRDVAVKLLLGEHSRSPELQQRFIREARISSQLQHPGIAPIHELAAFPDGRPYFTMKVVKGHTLAQMLSKRTSLLDDRGKFLKVFEQVCQTLAYAHAHRVIHRDLKPSNVMVGAYGEVQVMDWGLAKVLEESQEATPTDIDRTNITLIAQQTDGPDSNLRTGIVGTPAYAAPEQLWGLHHLVNERADVFGLGALLCEIISGRPPYERISPQADAAVFSSALAAAHARLDASQADAEIILLAKRCLAFAASQRPRDAGVVAGELTAYLESVATRLRQAELERTAALVEAREQRRRRRLTLGLAAAVVAALVLFGGGVWLVQSQYADTERNVEASLSKAEQSRAQYGRMPAANADETAEALLVLSQALAAVEEAESVLATGRARTLFHQRVSELRNEVELERIQLQREMKLFRDLDAARVARLTWIETPLLNAGDEVSQAQTAYSGTFDYAGSVRQYQAALADFGLQNVLDDGSAVLAVVGRQREPVREAIVEALDDWSFLAAQLESRDLDSAVSLSNLAQQLDTDDWRNRVRAGRGKSSVQQLTADAAEALRMRKSPVVVEMLARSLRHAGGIHESKALLRAAQWTYPDDIWTHYALGAELQKGPERNERDLLEAAGCYRAVLALRPNVVAAHTNLGTALMDTNDLDGAVIAFRAALEIAPRHATAHINLGKALFEKGDVAGAIVEFQTAISINPRAAAAYNNLGATLLKKNDPAAAIASFNTALKLNPQFAEAHCNLGVALFEKHDWDGAVAALEQAVKINPRFGYAFQVLGAAFYESNKPDAAIAASKTALDIEPRDAAAHCNLGLALAAKRDWEDAIAAYKSAIEIDPRLAQAHGNLGAALLAKGDLAGAIAAFRKTVQLKPDFAAAHYDLGNALNAAKDLDGAIEAYEKVVQLTPSFVEAHCSLGAALSSKGDLRGAADAYTAALKVNPRLASAHGRLGDALMGLHQLDEAVAAYKAAIAIEPQDAGSLFNLGLILQEKDDLDGAIAAYAAVLQVDPSYAPAAINLGTLRWQQHDADGAVAAFQQAIDIDPTYAEAHHNLAGILAARGEFARARDCLQRGLAQSTSADPLRQQLHKLADEVQRFIDVESNLADVLAGKSTPENSKRLAFVDVCRRQRRFAMAARFLAEACLNDAKLAEDRATGHRYDAACYSVLAATGQGSDAAELAADERARLRTQAVDWLRADLAAWTRDIESDQGDNRERATKKLKHWQADSDLAGIREEQEIAKLPREEQDACRRLWADVQALLNHASAGSQP